ncbi:Galactose oxidase/kelch repeat superfamily protein [Raphanus sativus]|uniref:F-box/kelch-repeat protein At2g22050-like n=1 Tax=Raphanus sativus TaxID=3726 RepID=A0A6J0KQG0_RAPSA|nr:F-box/kelch-repeat protein At2g22050-like [Raphanus sativus]KAJ4868744.1 Galactose oxidase/kelch repeat superfamily protein [Raphanus sativus]
MSNSNADEPPEKRTTHPPPPPPQLSLSSLPDDIVLSCLARVPRSHHLNISWVSKNLTSLVRSPELNRLRSTLLPKNSLHVCFEEVDDDHDHSSFHWFNLNETPTREYCLVPNPTPFPPHPHKYGSSTVALGSKIFFVGGSTEHSSDLWILDTQTRSMTQGPSMTVPRSERKGAAGVIDGKIYVIGGGPFSFTGDIMYNIIHDEFQVEVFDPNSETWELAGVEKLLNVPRCSASVEGKVFVVEPERTSVYDPREGEGERMVHMVSHRLSEGDGSKDEFSDMPGSVCVVEDVLFAFFYGTGLMWFDTKLSVWRRLVGRDGKELPFNLNVADVAEYEGRLVVFYTKINLVHYNPVNTSVQCIFVSLDRAGGKICGTVDWSGILATVPVSFRFIHCLPVSE